MQLFLILLVVVLAFTFMLFKFARSSLPAENPTVYAKPTLIIFLLIPVLTMALYYFVGNYQGVNTRGIYTNNAHYYDQQLRELANKKIELDEVVQLITARLQSSPNDVYGWFLLGKLQYAAQRFQQSEQALARAYALAEDDLLIIKAYAQSLFAAGEITAHLDAVVKRWLSLEPNNRAALNLQALSLYEHKHYQAAANLWSRLQQQSTADSAAHQALQKLIDKANAAAKSMPQLSFELGLHLTDLQRQQYNYVFIYLKPANSPRPLWAKKVKMSAIGNQILLTAADQMIGATELDYPLQAVVGIKLSKSGQVFDAEQLLFAERKITIEQAKKYVLNF